MPYACSFWILGATRLALALVVALGALDAQAQGDRILLGTGSGGVDVYYNATGGEIPTNVAFWRGQFSLANTNGAEFNFDATPIPGTDAPGPQPPLTWFGLFQAVPNQFGVDLVLHSPSSNGSVPTPVLTAYENGNNSIPGRIPAGPVTWAINGYTGPTDGPANPANLIINSLFRGGSGAATTTFSPPSTLLGDGVTFTLGTPVPSGTTISLDVSGEFTSDGLIHWYTITTPDSPVANFELTGKIFFSGTLVYDSAIDPPANNQDFYAGSVIFEAEVVCGTRYVALPPAGQDFIPSGPIFLPNNCRSSLLPCATIQRTVDIACEGDTIQVGPGTFAEQVDVPKRVTIVGSGAASTTIEPTSVAATTTSLSSGNPIAPIVLVHDAVDVRIEDLAVDGSAAAFSACSPGYMGIFFRNASGTVDDAAVRDVFLPSAAGCQAVVAILAQSGGAGSTDVTVTDTSITNYGKNGITCNEPATTCDIERNIVTGRGPVGLGDAAQNGIQLGFGAAGLVADNDVSDNLYTPASVCSTGVLVFQSDGAEVVGNDLTGNLCDLLVFANDVLVEGNDIASALDFPLSVIGDDNIVDQNYVNGSASDGVYLDGIGNALTCNRIVNSAGAGVLIDALSASGSTAGTPNSITSNTIAGNAVGVDASAVTAFPLIDATSNYWGCPTGANTLGCDTTTGSFIDVTPFAAAEPACVTCAGAGGDLDNDGVCTPVDNCPTTPNGGQANADGDALGDACDPCPDDPDDDADGDTICGDVDNCPADSNMDQDDLDNDGLGDVCDGNESSGSLVLNAVTLRRATNGRTNGSFSVRGELNTNDTLTGFQAQALAGQLAVHVVDAGDFDALIPITGCVLQGSRPSVVCRSVDKTVRARFSPSPPGPFLYRVTISVRSLTSAVTGVPQPLGPVVDVRIDEGPAIDRVDEIGNLMPCAQTGTRVLRCREP